jgi:hypothetical protein
VRHWDLLLEAGSLLRAWRLAEPLRGGARIAATAMFDHRLLYLDYEGPIAGDRGRVVRCERGTFHAEVQSDEEIVVRLEGERLRGMLRLLHEESDVWRCEFRADTTAS